MKKCIDTHVHSIFHNSVEDSVEIFQKIFAWTGIEKAIFLGLPQESEEYTDFLQNLKTIFYKQYFNSYGFAGLYHDTSLSDAELEKDFLRQAEETKKAGFDGMKMLDGKPSMRRVHNRLISDPVYDKFYSFMEENDLPITLHNADPSTFWDITKMSAYALEQGWYCGNGMSKDEMFEDVMSVMKKHPKLRLTLAHFGFTCDNIRHAERFLGDYEHTMFDTTPGAKNFQDMLQDWDTWRAFIVKYQDRIKYGTDTSNYEFTTEEEFNKMAMRPSSLQRRFFEGTEPFVADGFELRGVCLEDDLLEKIYRKNTLKEYGEPKEINKAYVREWLNSAKSEYKANEQAMRDLDFIEKNIKL